MTDRLRINGDAILEEDGSGNVTGILDQFNLGGTTGATSYADLGLLALGGYAEGDVVPISSVGPALNRSESVTSTSYTSLNDLYVQTFMPDSVPGTLKIGLAVTLSAGTSETVYARIQNTTDSEVQTGTEVSHSTTSFTVYWSGWVDLVASTSPIQLQLQGRTDTGTSSTISAPVGYIGVEL